MQVVERLPLPDSVEIAGAEIATDQAGSSVLHLTYRAPTPLPPEAEQIIARQAAGALGAPDLRVRMTHLLPPPPADTAAAGAPDAGA